MKQLNLMHIGVVTLIGIVLMTGYHFYRQSETTQLLTELHETRDESTRKQLLALEIEEQKRQLEGTTDVSSFVESLYLCASQSGVTGHEVTTSKQRAQTQTRRSRKSRRQGAGEELKINRLQVSLNGEYRNIAEYLRKVQQLDSLKQIVRFEMSTDQGLLKMSMLLDLYSLKGREQ